MITVTLFSSNISRVIGIHRAAKANGRKVCIAGRSLANMIDNARQCGYIPDDMHFVDMNDADSIPTNQFPHGDFCRHSRIGLDF